ncbi:MFS transporter [Pseudonocardia saturnea]
MSLLDVSIVSVALPSIQSGLGTSPAGAQWVVSGYALAFGLALVPAGRLGDAVGRRRMFLGALAAFVLFSGLAGAAPTTGLLIAARLCQGLAAGALAPQNTALIQQLFSGAERGRAFGFFGAVVGISTAVGPVAGGLILALAGEADGWRWIFFINLPIGAVALLLATRLIPRTEPGPRGHVDGVGVALLGGGVLAVMLPLVEAEADGLRRLWWLFPVGAALIAAFVAWERRLVTRDRAPLLDVRLLTHTAGYASGAALGTVYIIGFSGIWLVFALFFQTGLGYTPLASGLAVTPFALGSAASALVGGRLVERMGRLLIVVGLGLVVAGLAATALVLLWAPPAAAGWAVAVPLLVAGIGGGWVIAPNTTLTLRCVPVRMAGSAGGALQSGQRIGSAVGTAALTGLFYAVLAATAADQRVAVATAIGAAAAWVGVALAIAVVEWRRDRRVAARAADPVPDADEDAVLVHLHHHY